MPFLFTNAALLTALAALGIPVVIHLLLKRKTQRVRFSTVRFFVRQDEQASARRKLRHLFLLFLRLLIVALIVLAFARPYLPLGAGGSTPRRPRQVVLVLDRSLSLQAKDGGVVRWSTALQRAREALSALRSEDRAALVTCAGGASVVSGFAPAPVIARFLSEQVPSHGAAELSEGLREAVKLIRLGEPRAASSIVVVSDLQRSGLGSAPGLTIPDSIEVSVLPVGDPAAPNLAVTDLQAGGEDGGVPRAVVAHHGDRDLTALRTELRVDGAPVASRTLALRAGATTNLGLTLPNLKPGWHDVEFRIHPSDALAGDDSRHLAVLVPEPVSVLLVEGRPRKRSFEEQTFFVAAALDPSFGTTNSGASRFLLRKVAPEGLAAALSGERGTPRPAVVVLPAQRALSAESRQALRDHLASGGGVLVFVGEETTANGFNADFAGVVPAALREVESAGPDDPWHVGRHDPAGPWFAPFEKANTGNLALPQFQRRFTVTSLREDAVTAWFEDGMPLLVSGEVGRGRVLLVNTSADTAWSDWPKHKTYVPWIQHAVRSLAGRSEEGRMKAGDSLNLESGSDRGLDLGSAASKARFRLVGSGGQSLEVVADARGRVDLGSPTPGVWSVRDAAGREVRRLSVNAAASEADLSAIPPGEFQGHLVREPAAATAGWTGDLWGDRFGRREFWRVLLLAALALLVMETLVSNRAPA